MSTYDYRDRRRQRIGDALAALAPDAPDAGELRERLEREDMAIAADLWTVEDRTYRAIAADRLWATREGLKAAVDADPVFLALGTTATLTDAQAVAIEGAPRGSDRPAPDFLGQVEAAAGNDETAVTELVHAVHQAWLAEAAVDQDYPYDDVGVLLPLRLETLFDAPGSPANPDPARWQLSLRVIPDEASIKRDDAFVSQGELAALRLFWGTVRLPGPFDPGWLDGDAAGIAWAMLSEQVTPARAAWLVARVQPLIDGDEMLVDPPADMPEGPVPNRVGGLPPRLTVSAVTRDDAGVATWHDIGQLPMDEFAVIDSARLSLELPADHATSRDAWWTSWDAAVEVGLAGAWSLADGLAPDTLDAIVVVGIGDEPPDEHFRAQSDAGELGVLRLGAPTNTVQGAPAADLANDAETWRRVARARIAVALDPNIVPASSAGAAVERQLTGSSGVVPFFPGADGPDDTRDSQRMAQALWPALQGHWLADLWEARDDAFRVSRWAFPLPDDAIPTPDEVRAVLHEPCEDDRGGSVAINLCPEGPLMPIRIGDQPYGLLPVTALSRWVPREVAGFDVEQQRRVEAAMAASLTRLRGTWDATARGNGTTVGASTERFMDLLGHDALSSRFIERWFAPVALWALPYQMDPATRQEFERLAQATYEAAAAVMGNLPETLHLTNGYWEDSLLPLVQPVQTIHRRDPEDARGRVPLTPFLALLVDQQDRLTLAEIFERVWQIEEGVEYRLAVLPDSLLIRLLVHACQIDAAWMSREIGGGLALAVLRAQLEAVRAIGCELDKREWNRRERDPETGAPVFRIQIPDERRVQLERALRATLDTAAHRIDPWITGFAWERLREHSASERHTHRLGAYGWVDGPFIGEPGPTDAGRIHTPSYGQTLAGIIMRDKFLSSARRGSTNDLGRNPWEMSITSSRARLAEEIADEVRLGLHIYEVLGRHVEAIVGTRDQVEFLRVTAPYAMRPERADPNEVCNGMEALGGLLGGAPPFALDVGQTAALQALRDALDVYGDLLMADGVMQVIDRRMDQAAETMDAASGFSRPPTFEFLRTPPSGYELESLVLGAVPVVAADAAEQRPLWLADPSVASFAEARIGSDWTWTAVDADVPPADAVPIGTATLVQLGLAPLDTLGLSDEFLGELARRTMGLPLVYIETGHDRRWTVTDPDGGPLGDVSLRDLGITPDELAEQSEADVQDAVRTQLGVPADSVVIEADLADPRLWIAVDERGALLGMANLAELGITPEQVTAWEGPRLEQHVRRTLRLAAVRVEAPAEAGRLRHLVAAIGDRPATGRDVTRDKTVGRTIDKAIYADLVGRYTLLHAACTDLGAALVAVADDAERGRLLRQALAWGVTSISESAEREALYAALLGRLTPDDAVALAALCATTAVALAERLEKVPKPLDLAMADDIGAPLENHEERKRADVPDGIATLARALADLASPQARFAIMATWPRSTLLERTHLEVDGIEPDLDEAWLTVVAAVRAPLARLEAIQLELAPALETWSNTPGDPWRTSAVATNLDVRRTKRVTDMPLDDRDGGAGTPLVTAYGSADAWTSESVAVGLIDAFGEAVPMPQRSTMTAFGFNAPAARAPQTILLAVPPAVRQRLDDELLREIVAETRELAHARTVRGEDLESLQALTPTMWLEASGTHGVRLEPFPLFT